MSRVEPALVVLLALSVSSGWPALGADLSTWSDLAQALGTSTNLSCSYSQSTTENGLSTIERFVDGPNAGWSLLTIDGKRPTQSQLNDYVKGIEQRADRTSPIALNVAKLVVSESVTALRNQDGLNEYRFRLHPEKPELTEITKALEGVATVVGSEAEEVRFILTNTRPAAYSRTFKVSTYHREIKLEWQPQWNAFFRTSESTQVEGKLLGLRSVSISTEVRYFDFQC